MQRVRCSSPNCGIYYKSSMMHASIESHNPIFLVKLFRGITTKAACSGLGSILSSQVTQVEFRKVSNRDGNNRTSLKEPLCHVGSAAGLCFGTSRSSIWVHFQQQEVAPWKERSVSSCTTQIWTHMLLRLMPEQSPARQIAGARQRPPYLSALDRANKSQNDNFLRKGRESLSNRWNNRLQNYPEHENMWLIMIVLNNFIFLDM